MPRTGLFTRSFLELCRRAKCCGACGSAPCLQRAAGTAQSNTPAETTRCGNAQDKGSTSMLGSAFETLARLGSSPRMANSVAISSQRSNDGCGPAVLIVSRSCGERTCPPVSVHSNESGRGSGTSQVLCKHLHGIRASCTLDSGAMLAGSNGAGPAFALTQELLLRRDATECACQCGSSGPRVAVPDDASEALLTTSISRGASNPHLIRMSNGCYLQGYTPDFAATSPSYSARPPAHGGK